MKSLREKLPPGGGGVTHHREGGRGEWQGVGVAEGGDELLAAGERVPPGEGAPGDRLHLPRPVQHHV